MTVVTDLCHVLDDISHVSRVAGDNVATNDWVGNGKHFIYEDL